MSLAQHKSTPHCFTETTLTDLNFDFYQRLYALTKDISPAQLEILRDHVVKISSEKTKKFVSNNKPALSSRETEVLVLVTNGYSRRDIGSCLGISMNTAARHIANIYQKLGISCVAEATHYALANNIIREDRTEKPVS